MREELPLFTTGTLRFGKHLEGEFRRSLLKTKPALLTSLILSILSAPCGFFALACLNEQGTLFY
jgi:hypothetical protein